MMKRGLFLITVVSVLFLFAGCALVADKDLEGTTWKLMEVILWGDVSDFDYEYILDAGVGIETELGVDYGDGFTYTLAGHDITISNSTSNITNGTYTYSIDGKNMTWKVAGLTIFTFRAQ
jgi:hypothetical protein